MGKKVNLLDVIKYCETRFNRGSAVNWKHSDFADLSQDILRETKVSISQSTLKRIFGKISVDNDYEPQQATVEALQKYGGYSINEASQPDVVPNTPSSALGNHTKNNTRVIIFIIIVAVICVLLVWFLRQKTNSTARIVLKETEGLVPATAFFDVQLPNSNDSVFVNFGDKSPLVYLKPGEKAVAHIYLLPGVFNVEMQLHGQTLAAVKVYIRSDNWIGVGFHRQPDSSGRYYEFPAIRSPSDRLFHIANSQLFKMGLDTTGTVLTRLCNFTPVAHNADDFIFEATFKNNIPEKGMYCRSTKFQVSGSNGVIRFKLVSSGCSLSVLNILSERRFEGTDNNMSQFVVDLRKWNSVKMIDHHQKVSLFVNNKLLYTATYQKTIGDIKGLFLEFEGTGFVKSCDLTTYDGKILYHF